MAVAFVALIAALSGTAVALPGKNKVDSGDIKNKQVKRADLANNAVTSSKVKNNSLLAQDFKAGQLPAGPKGDPGARGPKGDKGDPGATKVVIREGTVVTIQPDDFEISTVDCAPGEVATGGGLTISSGQITDLVPWDTRPLDKNADDVPDGWVGSGRNVDANDNNTGTLQVRAEVVCASP